MQPQWRKELSDLMSCNWNSCPEHGSITQLNFVSSLLKEVIEEIPDMELTQAYIDKILHIKQQLTSKYLGE